MAVTWVRTASPLPFERFTKIVQARDGRVLAQGRTVWCAIDAQTKRPAAVSPLVRDLFSTAAD